MYEPISTRPARRTADGARAGFQGRSPCCLGTPPALLPTWDGAGTAHRERS